MAGSKAGFNTIVKPDIVLNMQDSISVNFTLPLGASLETVRVEGGAPLVNTESAALSTVIDRKYVENIPLNGRSFLDLILLTTGVVTDARINGMKDNAAMVYLPYWAYTPMTLSFLVRSAQPSSALIPEIRRAIWQIDPQIAIPTLKSMDEQVSDSVAGDRFQAMVVGGFGAAALFLAVLGVYGVLAYAVSLRRQEFGIRIALGSGKRALIRLVLRQAAQPVLLGTGIGLTMTMIAQHWVRNLLYQLPLWTQQQWAPAYCCS